jgi:hypothetical protein
MTRPFRASGDPPPRRPRTSRIETVEPSDGGNDRTTTARGFVAGDSFLNRHDANMSSGKRFRPRDTDAARCGKPPNIKADGRHRPRRKTLDHPPE